MSKGKNFAIGAAVAGVVGYVAGILTAPKSGKETRQDIQTAAIKKKREAEKMLKKLYSDIEDLIDQGKQAASQMSAKSHEDWDKAVTVALGAKERVREVLSALHEGGADDKDLDTAIKEANSAVEHLKSYLDKNVKI
jgi:gas vesicle protein